MRDLAMLVMTVMTVSVASACQRSNRLDLCVEDATVAAIPRGILRADVENIVKSDGIAQFLARFNTNSVLAVEYSYLKPWNRYLFIYKDDYLSAVTRRPADVAGVALSHLASRVSGDDLILYLLGDDLNQAELISAFESDRTRVAKRKAGESSNLGPLPYIFAPMMIPMLAIAGPVMIVNELGTASFWRKYDIRKMSLPAASFDVDKLFGKPREVWESGDRQLRLYGKKPMIADDGELRFVGIVVVLEHGTVTRAFTSHFLHERHPATLDNWSRQP